ncbi:MAG TPA: Rap1a/Tai family immunity protein [Gammaproteobacteria bacterium]|jgi:hypothetical protein
MQSLQALLIIWGALIAGYTINAVADDNTANTGNELIRYCNDQNQQANNTDWFVCIAFVDGISKGFKLGATMALAKDDPAYSSTKAVRLYNKTFHICIPDDSTRGQSALVVSKFLKDHPEKLNDPDIFLILQAFKGAWPCTAAQQ